MELLQDLKYKVQEIMNKKDEEASAIDEYKEKLEERISTLDALISSLERPIQLLADSEEVKPIYTEDQEQDVEFRRKLEQESS